MIKQIFQLLVVSSIILLTACQSSGRYAQHQDSAPNSGHDQLDMRDVTPRYEPYKPFNSRAYEVLGKRYYPMQTGKGFTQEGFASWYGQKFHGHLTSNGETYNMFAMTAAHKTLPLPSFVRVTNLANGRSAVVRVNDRGPFHSDRIIDLSYAAAIRLGYQKHGTAKVRLEVIHFDENNNVTVGNQPTVSYAEYAGLTPPTPAPATEPEPDMAVVQASQPQPDTPAPAEVSETFIQVAALSDLQRAQSVSDVLSALYQVPAQIPLIDNIYKLRLGPLKDRFQVQMLLDELKNNGYPHAYAVSENL
ncbi:septal ring lytic transglycosylase RlpA family protein [Salinimonas lutimaris]|uniref:septal ring lytic transglycosylase RlpA family protein n=1 Tax=Salinimonas lutimaris TaxID=914153 RepID=UPI0010BFDBF0|nr:septal ring lytic transglycosylase RlpA family protein [Salinimonas lutimaris]